MAKGWGELWTKDRREGNAARTSKARKEADQEDVQAVKIHMISNEADQWMA